VTITGSGFTGATSVKFGSLVATFAVVDDGHITATSPADSIAQTINVRVTAPAGTSPIVTADKYTYVKPPQITSVSPASGPRAGGQTVTITGTGFSTATGVRFASHVASFVIVDANHITTTSPAVPTAQTDNVRVTNASGISPVVAAGTYSYK
jgi:hypothetical protein